MMDDDAQQKDLEVQVRADTGKAVIEGKTVVPFQSLVTLILQRKVQLLFKQWSKEPVVVSSELLTGLASAPQDSQENRANQLLVALGVGALAGIAGMSLTLVLLETAQIFVTRKELLTVFGVIVGVACVALALMRVQRARRGDRIVESIEKLSSFLSGK
jgi:hypothetical protein